jgi:hypothetical protein
MFPGGCGGAGTSVIPSCRYAPPRRAGMRESVFLAADNPPERIEHRGVFARHTLPATPLAFGCSHGLSAYRLIGSACIVIYLQHIGTKDRRADYLIFATRHGFATKSFAFVLKSRQRRMHLGPSGDSPGWGLRSGRRVCGRVTPFPCNRHCVSNSICREI